MEDGYTLVVADLQHAEDITKGNAEMALETEDKKLDTKIMLNATQTFLRTPKFGYCLVTQDKKADFAGYSMIASEFNPALNAPINWFQSVYVSKDHRKKGLFKKTYLGVQDRARDAGVYSLKLYVDIENENAKQVYSKMGMKDINQDIFEVDLFFNKDKKIEFNKEYETLENTEDYSFGNLTAEDLENIDFEDFKPILSDFEDLSNIRDGCSSALEGDKSCEIWVLKKNGEIIGYASGFQEYSDWRNIAMFWVNDLRIKNSLNDQTKEVTAFFLDKIFQNVLAQKSSVFRIQYANGEEWVKPLLRNCGVEESHYRIYEQVLQNDN